MTVGAVVDPHVLLAAECHMGDRVGERNVPGIVEYDPSRSISLNPSESGLSIVLMDTPSVFASSSLLASNFISALLTWSDFGCRVARTQHSA